MRRSPSLLVLLPLASAPGCDALEHAVMRQTSEWEAPFLPSEIGAGLGLALAELRDYQQRTALILAHWPEMQEGGCVVPDVRDDGAGAQVVTFNYYGCEDQQGFVHATVETTSSGSSLSLAYEDYREGDVTVEGSVQLVDEGGRGRILLDYQSFYQGMDAGIVAEGEWAGSEEDYTVRAEGVLEGASGLSWTYEARDVRLADDCNGVLGGALTAVWEGETSVESGFPSGTCSECYELSVNGSESETFCPSQWLDEVVPG